jgi:hypothetical protein
VSDQGEDVPGNSIILTVRVAITEKESLGQ